MEKETAAEGAQGITIMNCTSSSGGRRGGWTRRCHWVALSDAWWERKKEEIGRPKGELFTGGRVVGSEGIDSEMR